MAESTVVKEPQAQTAARPNDLELLRAYEPILAFTEGEMFFPMKVDGYIRLCSLTARTVNRRQEVIAAKGSLRPETLARLGDADASRSLSLRFVAEPLSGLDYRRWSSHRPRFKARGRLARVGLIGRLADAIFRLTFLLRGRVPGGTTAAAQLQYAALEADAAAFAYHGRVFRQGGYTVLNYQFFYAMNDWRSSFLGVNDHEADWEQVFVYLAKGEDGRLGPVWVAYASHDFHGADLRRRWDDPDLTIVEGHPVIFAAAGSHASYFQAGEYVTSVELKPLKPLSTITELLSRFWRDTLGQGDPEGLVRGVNELVTVPFVDYARGDGVRIGPGESREWTPVVIDDDVGWVDGYRGLWGLDTQDVFAGERAPAGPKYNRDGSVRRSWYDPIGWAELDLEPPPAETGAELSRRLTRMREEADEVATGIAAARDVLPELALEARALDRAGAVKRLRDEKQRRMADLEDELRKLVAREEDIRTSMLACERLQAEQRAGYRAGPKEHIRNHQVPEPPQTFREGRIAELWAAGSIGFLLLFGSALIAVGAPWFTALFLLIAGAVLVDNILRGTVVHFLLSVSVVLAVITALVLIYKFFWWLALAALAAAGLLILTNNLRELRRR